MQAGYEVEYKTAITQDNASFLMQTGLFTNLVKQQNFYLDTADHVFNKKQIMLRIRVSDRGILFTSKSRTVEGLWEQEFYLESMDYNQPKIMDFLKLQQVYDPLVLVGKTQTYRYTYKDDFGEWCLDFTTFSTTSDIELEYEVSDATSDRYDHFLQQIKKWDINLIPIVSKYERLLIDLAKEPILESN